MSVSRIVLRLARNPGTEFADGDDHRGYTLTCAVDDEGRLEEGALKGATVRRFAPDEDPREGRLVRKGAAVMFAFADGEEPVEGILRAADHRFALGEYVSVTDEDGRPLTYKVTEATPL